jgi:nitrite reductase/ring-hydroxylating ferredoxin subunit
MSEWNRVCAVGDLPDGEPKGFRIGDVPVVVTRVDGTCYAMHDVCTHAHALLSEGFLEGHVIECPLHGAKYDVRNGKCLAVANTDAKTFPVQVEAGEVYVTVAMS